MKILSAAPAAVLLPALKTRPQRYLSNAQFIASQLQREENLIASQRLENFKFILNKRWIRP